MDGNLLWGTDISTTNVKDMVLSPDETYLGFVDGDYYYYTISTATGTQLHKFTIITLTRYISISPNSSMNFDIW